MRWQDTTVNLRSAARARCLLGAGVALWLVAVSARPAPTIEQRRSDAEELVFLLQYIGGDYGTAVREGRIVDAREYAEMLQFVAAAKGRYADLRPEEPASAPIPAALSDLARRVRSLASAGEVRNLAMRLAARLADEMDVATSPARAPDPERGRSLYASDCAVCHGARGGGDGAVASQLDPPPTSFRDPRMNQVSPHQVFGAMLNGIPGTAMPSWRGARPPGDLWDIASFVMTLREGSVPRVPAPVAGSGSDPGLGPAREIEAAFERIAETVFPSVVGVSSYVPAPRAKAPRAGSPGWRAASRTVDRYPGYRRERAGSGFVISDDGFVLSCAYLIRVGPKGRPADVVDVELGDNVHYRARIVGLEPSIDLALLKIDASGPLHPATIGDSEAVRPGQWAIVLGDPPGVERNFAVGTIAALPERQCYQENLTSTLLQVTLIPDPGSFGGPVVNIRGEVVGLVTPRGAAHIGPGDRLYALPADLATTISDVLRERESRHSPWLGISVLELSAARRGPLSGPALTGVYVEDVFAPSPGARAGVRAGDVLVSLEGHRLFGVPDFQRWLYLLGIGRTITLEIAREGRVLKVKATIEERPAAVPPL